MADAFAHPMTGAPVQFAELVQKGTGTTIVLRESLSETLNAVLFIGIYAAVYPCVLL